MIDFFFDPDKFVPRGHCGQWNPWFETMYVMANLLIFLAYMVIPYYLFKLTRGYSFIANDHILKLWFSAFIVACGIGHLESVIPFYWPVYHAFAVWHVLTALVSWGTIGVLIGRSKIAYDKYRDTQPLTPQRPPIKLEDVELDPRDLLQKGNDVET